MKSYTSRNQTGLCQAWTPEQITQAVAMSAAGASASEIARHFGRTRNAVCGLLFRAREAAKREQEASPAPTPAPVPESMVASLEAILGSRAQAAILAHSAAMRVAA